MIEITYSGSLDAVLTEEKKSQLKEIRDNLYNKTGRGSDFLGWLDWPSTIPAEFMERIGKTADFIKEKADVLVVIGIGGSYLGAKAALTALSPYFNNNGKKVEVLFAGHQVSGEY